MRPLPSALLLLAVCLAATAPADAQIRASEPSSFTQAIDGTVFRIDYYRPRTRGRSPLFGPDAVVWEHTWTPGANWATKLRFQKPIELDGVPVPAGIYSLWFDLHPETMMPQEFFLEPDTLIFHTVGPQPADDQIRFPVVMTEGAFHELLTWDFEDIRSDGGTLALRWGTHRIAYDVKVEPSQRATTTVEEAAPVLGDFTVRMATPEGVEAPPFTISFLRTDDGVLHADWKDVPAMPDGSEAFFEALDMWLLPAAEGWFVPGEAYDGELRETWAGFFFEFELDGDASESFILLDEFDRPFARGTRIH
jgi:hypothetical protein